MHCVDLKHAIQSNSRPLEKTLNKVVLFFFTENLEYIIYIDLKWLHYQKLMSTVRTLWHAH